ncbi:chemotaxis regulatin CheY-phosphate phosphatase CheZ [Roseibium hamelinense]|uniref:Chemotaxis regulatin CheY-phosphate phosphatase CheZ n=1 Tax=Roseibium hamelinense TaxID=150831 RepID=A0A562T9S5_9HYPH|nr:protein phosphatase CheZ [Roseibium hamelinense]MTI45299.1 chemotaxis protein [Roseibium hamelinense]TWI90335.1 chemotaxis regulatin CheY-phosphate phosphatase CheZ [Roseibium hamelinense]
MQTVAEQEDEELIGEAEYHVLEQTLMESDRGRRFLAEFVKRNKTPETQEILSAIKRIEKTMTRQRKVPDLNKIRLDIADMHEAIERTKLEIANIKDDSDDSNRFTDASHELDAIVTQTEGATQSILEAAEQIQEQAWILREKGADDSICDDIDAKATEIFMACSFQDLTGQRTNKVVQVLRYLESRINLMINIWGIDDLEAEATAGPQDSRPDAHLLNGPQRAGQGVSQNNVDELFSVKDDVIDTALAETGADEAFESVPKDPASKFAGEADIDAIMAGDPDTGEAAADEADVDAIMAGDGSEKMDAAAIDDMFASVGSASAEPESSETEAEPDNVVAMEQPGTEDDVLDEEAIAKLFDAEAETEADADWEMTAEEADEDGSAEDPLEEMSEAERQALFN